MSNCDVIIDLNFEGPSVLDIVTLIDDITEDPIKVRWGNTRDEINLVRSLSGRKFLLHVKGFSERDRATATLGLPLKLEQPVTERAKLLLNDAHAYDWRTFCKECEGGISPKYILLKLVADSLRRGNRPALAEIMEPLFLGSISSVDVDVLLRLKSGKFKK